MSDRRPVVGLLLAAQGRLARPRRSRHHYRSDDDDHTVQLERLTSQDFLPQEYRFLPSDVLFHGLRFVARVRQRQLHQQPQSFRLDDVGRRQRR